MGLAHDLGENVGHGAGRESRLRDFNRELELAGCRHQVEADRLDAPPRDRRLGQGPAPLSPFRAKDPRIDHPDQPGAFVDLDLRIDRFAAWRLPEFRIRPVRSFLAHAHEPTPG